MKEDESGFNPDAPETGASGDPLLGELRAQPVALLRPERQTTPFIFASPHSGRLYPEGFVRQSRLDAVTLRKSEYAFVDELFAGVTEFGAPLLAARFPRAFVDVNRAPGELDTSMFEGPLTLPSGQRTPRLAAGLGVIPRIVRDGLEIYRARLPSREAQFRVEHFYRPYHTALAKLVAETRSLFGIAVVVDCHSMPPTSRGTEIVIGDCYGESAASDLIVAAQRSLSELGFTVARNAPYAGGYTTNLYGKPESGVHAFQIEVSRALYLDEARMQKTAGFAECQQRLRRFVARLVSSSWIGLGRRQTAAE